MSIDNVFKALSIVDSLSADDFVKFKGHLEVVESKFKSSGRAVAGGFYLCDAGQKDSWINDDIRKKINLSEDG